MPFPGQNETRELTAKVEVRTEGKKEAVVVGAAGIGQAIERKTASQPTGRFNSTSIGINSTLNPTIKKNKSGIEEQQTEQNEVYTQEQFDHSWKEFALKLKREKKDSLFATLMNTEKKLSSSHLITLEIQNSIQQTELDEYKGEIVRFLRMKLNNTNINLEYNISEKKSVQLMDSKATFDKLAEQNSSLNKFRKLFNLDIEF